MCLLNKEIDTYQKNIVNQLFKNFNQTTTKKANISAHFTLKYSFYANSKQLKELKKIVSNFSKKQKKQKIKIGGFDNFEQKVIFLKINPSPKVKNLITELHKELKKLNWLTFKDIETNGINLHATISQDSTEKQYPIILKFLKNKEQYFNTYLDNISIMKLSTKKNFRKKFIIEKKYKLQ
jgi:2'-5' RNA ligase